MRIVLFKKVPVTPAVREVRIPLKSRTAKAVLANSISITPGTITVKIDGDIFTVHCLSEEMLDGIESSSFMKLLTKMEASL